MTIEQALPVASVSPADWQAKREAQTTDQMNYKEGGVCITHTLTLTLTH
jgi:hypothetical protein